VAASIPDLLAEHRETLVRWGEESERLDERRAVGRANKLFEEAHAQFKLLRESEEGRAGIAALMHDPNPYVASTAAGHCLLWEPDDATAVLGSNRRVGGCSLASTDQRQVHAQRVAIREVVL
jgi:hypothetical protein